jgi:Kdo2-lipid IVA lauroyltransferase/acyltransferase
MIRSFLIVFLSFLLRGTSFIYSLLPRFIRWKIALLLYHLYWNILKIRRYTVYRNIYIVNPSFSKEKILVFAKISLQWMAYYLIQFLTIPSLRAKDLDKRFFFHGLEHLDQAKSYQKGVLLLSCHMGNPDLGLNGLALKGEKIWVISKKFSSDFANELWFRLRSRSGLSYIPAHGRQTTYDILRALSQKGLVLFVTDQFMGPPYGIESRFFGKKTGTAYGLARFFVKTKAPILPCYTIEDDKGACHIHFEKPLTLSETLLQQEGEDSDSYTLRLVESFNRSVESMILKHPHHWMWIHRRWKKWKI